VSRCSHRLTVMSSNWVLPAAPTLFGPRSPRLLPQGGDTSRGWCRPRPRPRSSSRSPQFERPRPPLARVSERCPRREVTRARRPGRPPRALVRSRRQGTPERPWGRSAYPHTPATQLVQLAVTSMVCNCAQRSSRHRHRRPRRSVRPTRSPGPTGRADIPNRRTSRGVRPSCRPTDQAMLKAVR
jgi:hypothetical protein